ncbi:hypothetical protein BsWGS_02768 [Bradybaena similaris]
MNLHEVRQEGEVRGLLQLLLIVIQIKRKRLFHPESGPFVCDGRTTTKYGNTVIQINMQVTLSSTASLGVQSGLYHASHSFIHCQPGCTQWAVSLVMGEQQQSMVIL